MRVIAGKAGSVPLEAPVNLIRPTTDRVKEALFSRIGCGIEQARVLDLFAGSGALGIEALSRGAREVVFVEYSVSTCEVIKKNLHKTKLEGGKVVHSTVETFLKQQSEKSEPFHLILADPPYYKKEDQQNWVVSLLENKHLQKCLEETGWFIVEKGKNGLPEQIDPWQVEGRRIYGGSELVFFQIKEGIKEGVSA